MNIASIDIGSNTVLLLIAFAEENSNQLKTVLNRYEIPRISRGLQENGNISSEAIQRLENVLGSYREIIDEYKCGQVLVNATNAMRIAKNSAEILNLIKDKFGFTVDVIPGRREAYLSYLGATEGLIDSENIVIDIGGGSTEIIIGTGSKVAFSESMGIGAVNLTEKHCASLPPSGKEIDNIKNEIGENISGLSPEKFITGSHSLIMTAVAGTPTTLSCISQNLSEYDEDLVEGSMLSLAALNGIIDELAVSAPQQVLERYGKIVRGREDVLLTGSLILKTALQYFGIDGIRVSGRGIRYGAVIDYLNRINQ